MHVKVTYLFFLSSGSKEHGPILMLRQSEAYVVSPLLNLCLIKPSLFLYCTHVLGRKVAPRQAREHNALKHGHMLVLKTRHFDRTRAEGLNQDDERVFFRRLGALAGTGATGTGKKAGLCWFIHVTCLYWPS